MQCSAPDLGHFGPGRLHEFVTLKHHRDDELDLYRREMIADTSSRSDAERIISERVTALRSFLGKPLGLETRRLRPELAQPMGQIRGDQNPGARRQTAITDL